MFMELEIVVDPFTEDYRHVRVIALQRRFPDGDFQPVSPVHDTRGFRVGQ